jgi:hypothetical protein
MGHSTVIAFPGAVDSDDATSAGSVALREVDAAIALVVAGVAGRVRLAGVPFLDAVAGTALARARAAGLAFRLEPTDREGVVTATIGPLEPAPSR